MATLSRAAGEVVLEHAAELIHPAGAKDKVGVEPGDVLRTRSGEADVSYANGSQIKVMPGTVLLFAPKAEKEEGQEGKEPTQLCVRLATGGITASIAAQRSADPKIMQKAVLLVPQGRVALIEGEVEVKVNELGDWQCSVSRGKRVLLTELSLRLLWQAQPGHRFRVQYVPDGVRITNLAESTRPVAIGLYANGAYEIGPVKGEVDVCAANGQRKTLRERTSTTVALPPPGTVIRGLDPGDAVLILRGKRRDATGKSE